MRLLTTICLLIAPFASAAAAETFIERSRISDARFNAEVVVYQATIPLESAQAEQILKELAAKEFDHANEVYVYLFPEGAQTHPRLLPRSGTAYQAVQHMENDWRARGWAYRLKREHRSEETIFNDCRGRDLSYCNW